MKARDKIIRNVEGRKIPTKVIERGVSFLIYLERDRSGDVVDSVHVAPKSEKGRVSLIWANSQRPERESVHVEIGEQDTVCRFMTLDSQEHQIYNEKDVDSINEAFRQTRKVLDEIEFDR